MTTTNQFTKRASILIAIAVLAVTAGTTWLGAGPAVAAPSHRSVAARTATATGDDAPRTARRHGKQITGTLNLNTATEDQLTMLPGVGPTKAERVLAYRGKHGKFHRVADLRRVKGFGYKTVKKLTPYLAVAGSTTLRSE
jgi:competence protein ComEA